MSIRIYQVDAFSSKPFLGNPAVVVVLKHQADDRWMQNVASEMNLSETAFLFKEDNAFHIRWFTPKVEVDLCGHATLASAHILWEKEYLGETQVIDFRSLSGPLHARKTQFGIELDFPTQESISAQEPPLLREALLATPINVERSRTDLLVELEDAACVINLKPNLHLLKNIDCRGIIVTARSDDSRYDFVSRFFAPKCGVDEDPACGSAHCSLGAYWQERLMKSELLGFQASQRQAYIKLRVSGQRTTLIGDAVTVLEGDFLY